MKHTMQKMKQQMKHNELYHLNTSAHGDCFIGRGCRILDIVADNIGNCWISRMLRADGCKTRDDNCGCQVQRIVRIVGRDFGGCCARIGICCAHGHIGDQTALALGIYEFIRGVAPPQYGDDWKHQIWNERNRNLLRLCLRHGSLRCLSRGLN